jgi:hypothetical protein
MQSRGYKLAIDGIEFGNRGDKTCEFAGQHLATEGIELFILLIADSFASPTRA